MAKSAKAAPKAAEKPKEVIKKPDLGAKRAAAKAKERAVTDDYAKANSSILPDGYPKPDATTTVVSEEVKEQAAADAESAEGGNIGSSEVTKPGTGS
jgi:hypothetical protein